MALVYPRHLNWFNPVARRSLEITGGMLSRASLDAIAAWPFFITRWQARFVHGFPPASPILYLFQVPPAKLRRRLDRLSPPLCFVGHTHRLELVAADGRTVTRSDFPDRPVRPRSTAALHRQCRQRGPASRRQPGGQIRHLGPGGRPPRTLPRRLSLWCGGGKDPPRRPARNPRLAAATMKRIAKYPVFASLGRGGMAQVFLVRVPVIERLAALKRLAPHPHLRHLLGDRRLRRMFRREAATLGGLAHPNVMSVLGLRRTRRRAALPHGLPQPQPGQHHR